jgi:predicted nucleic acid-binding protein
MIVLDANIIVRAVLGRRARQIIETYSARAIRFLAPDVAFDDASHYLPILLAKRNRPESEGSAMLRYLHLMIEPVDPEIYAEFEDEARQRLRGRDEEDWPVLAAALALRCPVWTEDADFFGTGVAVWTTSRVEIYLKARVAERASPLDE